MQEAPGFAPGTAFIKEKTALKLIQTTLSVGLSRPFRALHLTDSHIALADMRDGERKLTLAQNRTEAFSADGPGAEACWQEQKAYAKKQGLPVLYTGDFCDFVSRANLEYAKEQFQDLDYFMAVGNHEFSLYVGEAFEDEAYKMQSYCQVQRYFRNQLLFDSRVMGGINFIAVDNGYYRFNDGQLFCLQEEAKKGLPMVLLMHNPIHTDELFHWSMSIHNGRCAYLTGTPEEMMRGYDEYRFRQQRPDEPTLRFMDYVNSQPLIKVVIAGHLHESHETALPSGIPQYVTGGGYKGYAREFLFI